jgi:outer membrane protein OmpA-like peptidoglycan-associated protein
VFEKDSHGEEGKSMVDAAVTNRGDSIFESAIVVEGYANGANSAEQLALSRSRAIAVRHYLEAHFILDASHIGIVTMKEGLRAVRAQSRPHLG